MEATQEVINTDVVVAAIQEEDRADICVADTLVPRKTPESSREYSDIKKIHNTKLTMDDVTGKNLPPDSGAEADKTIQVVDANKNGIRDDVELAIFKAYPNSAKTRAVLLQYALALQMEAAQTVVNKETVIATIQEEDRADICVADTLVPRKTPESAREYSDIEKIDAYTDFVKKLQINTSERKRESGENS